MPTEDPKFISGFAPLLIWVVIIAFLNYSSLVPRFEAAWLNYASFILLALAAPALLLRLAIGYLKGVWRWLTISIAAVILLPVSLIVLYAASDMSEIYGSGVDLSFEKIKEIKSGGHYYRLYRTNGGATTSYGLALRKEFLILPGVKLISLLQGFYPAYEARFEQVEPSKMRLIVSPYKPEGKEKVYEFSL